MLELKSLPEAERFVARQKRLGNNVRWDGWKIIFFRPHPTARVSTEGVWNAEANAYGFDNASEANSNGIWEIDHRNVRRANKHRKN